MAKAISSLVFIFILSINSVLAQDVFVTGNIWQEYMQTNPETEDLLNLTNNSVEPYRTWLIKELFNRDITDIPKFKLIYLLEYDIPEEYANRIWVMLETESNPEDLGYAFCYARNEDRKKVLEILDRRYFSNKELAKLMHCNFGETNRKNFEPWANRILERFILQNPTNEDLFHLAQGFYGEFSIKELLKRPLTTKELIWLSGYSEEVLNLIPFAGLSDKELWSLSTMGERFYLAAQPFIEAEDYLNRQQRKNDLIKIMTNKQP